MALSDIKLTAAKKKVLAGLLAAYSKPDNGQGTATAEDGTPRFVFLAPASMEEFVAQDAPRIVLMDASRKDGDKIAYILTAEGAEYAASSTGGTAQGVTRTPIDTSGIVRLKINDFVKPEPGTRIRQSVYPFDKLEAPVTGANGVEHDGFFIPATAENPEPWKKLKGTVIAQNRRYKEKNAKDPNVHRVEFSVIERTANGVKGAYVARVA